MSISFAVIGQTPVKLQQKLDQQASAIEQQVIEWRRYFHQYPELSNREVKTGAKIAELLRSFGIEVTYPVAKTGVVGLLKGGQPGPVVALRADIDALPVTERNSLPFASKEHSVFNGQETGVMHACGHDSHISILLGVAKILADNKSDLRGTVKFIFQPAEEGPPVGEEGGAPLMIKEGVLENPKVDAIFGLHIQSLLPLGTLNYKPGAFMASPVGFSIKVKGKQAHGAHSVGWHRPDCCWKPDRFGITNSYQQANRHHEVTRRPNGWNIQRGYSLQHHPGRSNACRNHENIRPGTTEGSSRKDDQHGNTNCRERRGHCRSEIHQQLSTNNQRSCAHGANGAKS